MPPRSLSGRKFPAPIKLATPVPSEISEEAERLWATGRFLLVRDLERLHFQMRPRGIPGNREACLWLEAVGDESGPALSVVACRVRRWLPAGTVTCRVKGRTYTLIPGHAFWDQEQQSDGTFETLTFSNFGEPEVKEAFAAIIDQDQPVDVCLQGGDDRFEFTLAADDVQQLRDMLVLYRARGGAW